MNNIIYFKLVILSLLIPSSSFSVNKTKENLDVRHFSKWVAPDTWLMKIDKSGNILCRRNYGTLDYDYGCCIRETDDGGCIILGDWNPRGLVLIKTNRFGDTMWVRGYDGLTSWPSSLSIVSEGGYIFIGEIYSSSTLSDIYVVKVDSYGNSVWSRKFGGAGWDEGHDIIETDRGNFVLTGDDKTPLNGKGTRRLYIAKIDNNGAVIWKKQYASYYDASNANSITKAWDNGYIVVGRFKREHESSDAFLMKINEDGDSLWTKLYGGLNGGEHFYSVKRTEDRGYIITGTTNSWGSGNRDFYLVKVDSTGNILWQKTYGGSGDDIAFCVEQTKDKGFVVVGDTDSYGKYIDLYMIKTDSCGDSLWAVYTNLEGYDAGMCVQQTADSGYIISGHGEYKSLGIEEKSKIYDDYHLEIKDNIFLSDKIIIQYNLPELSHVELEIFNNAGQEVIKLVDSYESAGCRLLEWDKRDKYGEKAPGGIYFVILRTEDLRIKEKFILIR